MTRWIAFVGTDEGIVVAGIGDDDVGVGGLGGRQCRCQSWQRFYELGIECRLPNFGLDLSLDFVLDTDDGLVCSCGHVGVGQSPALSASGSIARARYGLDGGIGALDADVFYLVGGLTDACGVDKTEGDIINIDGVFDGIAGGAMDVADDGAIFMKQAVEQGALAYVWCSDDGYGDAVLEACPVWKEWARWVM